MLICLARLTSIGEEAITEWPKPMAAAPIALWFLSSTGPRMRFSPWHSSAIFLRTASSFSTLAEPQTTNGTSTAARTFFTTATACSGVAFWPFGSMLFSCRTRISAPNSFTHFLAQAAGSETTSLKGASAASGQSSGAESQISMAILGGVGMLPSNW